MMLKMCKGKLHEWMITFLIFTTLLNKRSHTGCIMDKRHNNADIHGDFTSTLFKSAVMQFCVITAEVSPLKTITAGCQQSWWRSRPWSPAAIKNVMSSGRGSFTSLYKNLFKLYHDHSERSFRCHWVCGGCHMSQQYVASIMDRCFWHIANALKIIKLETNLKKNASLPPDGKFMLSPMKQNAIQKKTKTT